MKVRIKFEKTDHMRFVGHLDIMRYFQKAMRRAHIPIKYSEGFSPHQIMSFGAPLSMGVQGLSEYMDIELKPDTHISSEEGVNALNAVMCDGMKIISFLEIADSEKPAMSVMASADYKVVFKEDVDGKVLDKAVKALLKKDVAQVEKKVKKKEKKGFKKPLSGDEEEIKTVDIRPLIHEIRTEDECIEGEKKSVLYMNISQGSVNNLKPDLVLSAIIKESENFGDTGLRKACESGYYLFRCEMYNENGESLEACGKIIR